MLSKKILHKKIKRCYASTNKIYLLAKKVALVTNTMWVSICRYYDSEFEMRLGFRE